MLIVMLCLPLMFLAASRSFEKALKQTNTSLKAAAIAMRMDPAQLRRQLDGHEHLSTRRVFDGMPPEFLQHYAFNLVMELGIPTEIKTAAFIERQMEQAS